MSESALPTPETLRDGRYVLGKILGEGGMAVVRVAHDVELGVDRAVKILLPHAAARQTLRRRLRAEARAMAKLNHPNILAIHDVGHEGELDYVVMDLADGGSLQDLVEKGPLDPLIACSFGIQVLSALAAAHAADIIHRDVKPHNILLDHSGRALLADFGIARLQGDDRRTKTGVAMGSIAYMPPEQRLDAARVGPEADIYAMGSTLYALVSARNPVDLFLAGPASPRWDVIPPFLQETLQRAVKMEPTDRWPDAASFARALMGLLDDAGVDMPSTHGFTLTPHSFAANTDLPTPTRSRTAVPQDANHDAIAYLDHHVTRAGAGLTLQGKLAAEVAPELAKDGSEEGALVPAPSRLPWLVIPVLVAALLVGVWFWPSPGRSFLGPSRPLLEELDGGEVERVEKLATRPSEPSVVVPQRDPVGSHPASGAWRGTMGGIAVTARFSGPPDRVRGTMVSSMGGNRATSEVAGTWNPATSALELVDQTEVGVNYSLVLSNGRLQGQVQTPRGKNPLILAR